MIRWEEGDYPAKIWGFLDLSNMAEGVQVQLTNDPNQIVVERGVYALVESSVYIEEEHPQSDIWTPIRLETDEVEGNPNEYQKRLYVVDTKAFADPLCVIPNIGAEEYDNEYLVMTHRSEWANDFISWIEMPHAHDRIEMNSPPPSSDEEEEEEEESSEEDEEEEE